MTSIMNKAEHRLRNQKTLNIETIQKKISTLSVKRKQ